MMNILIAIPVLLGLSTFFYFYTHSKNTFESFKNIPQSILLTLVSISAWIAVSTEILSLFNIIQFYSVLFVWIIPILILAIGSLQKVGLICLLNKNTIK
jgi:hypothetical protein